MAEFVYNEEKALGIDEPIILENNTDASFDVGIGVIFRKSGLYRVSVDGKYTSVEIEPERKRGAWIKQDCGGVEYTAVCSECGYGTFWSDASDFNFCPHCGADMRGEQE